MSAPENLIRGPFPGGVEFKALDEIGTIYGGLTGKTKADFVADGNARFVSYVAVFDDLSVGTRCEGRVRLSSGERQTRIRHGDVLFTASSENANDVGMSSAVTVEPVEPVYLNSFCFGFRPNDVEMLRPEFSKHLFRSANVRAQIVRTANGVTRFNVSKERFRTIQIPLPPPRIQLEIARTLDRLTELKTELQVELEAELEARRQQYAYYRDTLVACAQDNVRWAALGELGSLVRGKRFTKRDMIPVGTGVPSIHYGEIYTHFGTSADKVRSNVRADVAPKLRFALPGDVVIAAVGETVEDVGKAVAWVGQDEVAVHDDCFIFRHEMDPRFVSYCFQARVLHTEKAKYVARAKVKRLSGENLSKLRIPVPPIEVQREVTSILDGFAELEAQLAAELAAELEARRRQYDYYRDTLLTFEQTRWVEPSDRAA